MSGQFTPERMEFEYRTSTSPAPRRTSEKMPFRVAILGDFSGRDNRGLAGPGSTGSAIRPVEVDIDNFESLPATLGAGLMIEAGGGAHIPLQFGSLDDFGPDEIFDRLDVFQRLKDVRGRLQDAGTFAEAAAEVRSWVTAEPDSGETPESESPQEPPEADESNDDTLERLLGRRPASSVPAGTGDRVHLSGGIGWGQGQDLEPTQPGAVLCSSAHAGGAYL